MEPFKKSKPRDVVKEDFGINSPYWSKSFKKKNLQALQLSIAFISRLAHSNRRELHIFYWYSCFTSKFTSIKQVKRWKDREQWEKNLSPQNKCLTGPSKSQFTQTLFSFKLTLQLGFFSTWMSENGLESAELNWFSAKLTQTPEPPIT